MKFILFATLFVSVQAEFNSWFTCTTPDNKPCTKLPQANTCEPNEQKIVEVVFDWGICEATGAEVGRIVLKGPAIRNVHGVGVDNEAWKNTGKQFDWPESSEVDTTGNCPKTSFTVEVDTCGDHFNANVVAEDSSGNSKKYFREFMRRNCPLTTSIKCTTPSGRPCEEMDKSSCESGDFAYEFCYATTFVNHDITIRTNYSSQECKDVPVTNESCRETHAYMNGFGADFIPEFSKSDVIGYSGDKTKCYTHTETINTCETSTVPKAMMNVVGDVTTAYNDGKDTKFFKACFDASVFQAINLNAQDGKPNGNTGPGTGVGAGPKMTKSPGLSKGTKQPASKVTKAPIASKGTKSPSSVLKRTRRRTRN